MSALPDDFLLEQVLDHVSQRTDNFCLVVPQYLGSKILTFLTKVEPMRTTLPCFLVLLDSDQSIASRHILARLQAIWVIINAWYITFYLDHVAGGIRFCNCQTIRACSSVLCTHMKACLMTKTIRHMEINCFVVPDCFSALVTHNRTCTLEGTIFACWPPNIRRTVLRWSGRDKYLE